MSGYALDLLLKPKADSYIVMILMFFVRLKMEARAVDYFYAVMPNVQAGYRKRGVILLKIAGNSLPLSDSTQQ